MSKMPHSGRHKRRILPEGAAVLARVEPFFMHITLNELWDDDLRDEGWMGWALGRKPLLVGVLMFRCKIQVAFVSYGYLAIPRLELLLRPRSTMSCTAINSHIRFVRQDSSIANRELSDPFIRNVRAICSKETVLAEEQKIFIRAVDSIEMQDIIANKRLSQFSQFKTSRETSTERE
jgi:hypothetical protein